MKARRMFGLLTGMILLLADGVAAIEAEKHAKNLDKELRGYACFLLAQIRTPDSDRRAIEVLIAAIDENFLPSSGSESPYGILEPPDALIAIGKPAVKPVLDELANTEEGGNKLVRLRNVLYGIEADGIEGVDCALIRIQAHIDKEANPKKKARLKATLEWLEGLKASKQNK